ncbi:MAG: PqqD family protein [Planctomycetes bacterium]|nr:PqqD family protein [Planctomycetota bacterium]
MPRRRENVVVDDLGDEVVFSDPVDGSAYFLNATARIVWDRCDGRSTTRQMAAAITHAYDVDDEHALADVEQVVVRLAEAGLLRTGGHA